MGWVGLNEKYCYFFFAAFRVRYDIACWENLQITRVMRTQCTDRVHVVVVLQKKAGLVLGSNLVYTVGGSFHCNSTISLSQPETGCLFYQQTCKNMGSTVMVSAFHVGVWWVGNGLGRVGWRKMDPRPSLVCLSLSPSAPCRLLGVMRPWFDFWFRRHVHCVPRTSFFYFSNNSLKNELIFTARCYGPVSVCLCLCLSVRHK